MENLIACNTQVGDDSDRDIRAVLFQDGLSLFVHNPWKSGFFTLYWRDEFINHKKPELHTRDYKNSSILLIDDLFNGYIDYQEISTYL